MANLQHFKLDTHFTALRQLPQRYLANLSVPAMNLGYTLSRIVGETIINVPNQVYIDNVMLRTSLDGNIYHPDHVINYDVDLLSHINIILTRSSATQYALRAFASTTTSSTVNFPAFTVEALLRLAVAPFS